VATLVALPIVFAPVRALIGFRSDHHRSAFGWRRVPYLWNGALLQFGGLAILPFAIILLQGDKNGSMISGLVGASLAFVLVGAGAHTVQTAGLALATDLATEETRPRVVALLYLMLLAGTLGSALCFGAFLTPYTHTHLVQLVQGAAVVTLALNVAALWKQEPRDRRRAQEASASHSFREAWREFIANRRSGRLLVAVGLGTIGFNMQDILLEPYGGQVLHLGVGATSRLTALMAAGAIVAFAIAARMLQRGADPVRLAAVGAVVGTFAFSAIIFAAPFGSPALFRAGTTLIGFGGGLFSVGTLTAAMSLSSLEGNGLALGAWGAVQATSGGLSVAVGGVLRDVLSRLAATGAFGPALSGPTAGYLFVYHLEIAALFAALVALGPLVAPAQSVRRLARSERFGLAEIPG
jgi:BCD family chlorophyll transporter-like MFS transporter